MVKFISMKLIKIELDCDGDTKKNNSYFLFIKNYDSILIHFYSE